MLEYTLTYDAGCWWLTITRSGRPVWSTWYESGDVADSIGRLIVS